MLVLNEKIQKEILSHAEREYPCECCGVLLGKRIGGKRIADGIVCSENKSSSDKTARFAIDPLEIMRIELSAKTDGLDIVGFYHSHPDCEAVLSASDAVYMLEDYSYPIVSARDGADGMYFRIASFEKIIGTYFSSEEELIITESEK